MKNISILKKLGIILLVTILVASNISICDNVQASAAEKPGKPKISLSISEDGYGINVNISKTTGADGYRIYIMSSYDEKYKKLADINLNGKKVQSYTVDNLKTGHYYFKVRAYKKSKGKKIWGAKSKSKNIILNKAPIIVFGSYEQDNDPSNGKEPIEWLVLDEKEDGSMLVISRYGLDAIPYNRQGENTTWKDSYLRNWMNNSFYEVAFNTQEKERIIETEIETFDSPYDLENLSSEKTNDRVFALGAGEVFSYFAYSYVKCACEPTAYALERGAIIIDCEKLRQEGSYVSENDIKFEGSCSWWPREASSSAFDETGIYYASAIISYDFEDANPDGEATYQRLIEKSSQEICARPAMWIKPE